MKKDLHRRKFLDDEEMKADINEHFLVKDAGYFYHEYKPSIKDDKGELKSRKTILKIKFCLDFYLDF